MTRSIIPILLVAIWPTRALGAILTMTGAEPGAWTENSVVYAEVASVTILGPNHVRLTLQVQATLTGAYDAAGNAALETDLHYGAKVSAVRERPTARTRVIAVVRRLSHARERPPFVPSDFVTFMPNNAALLTVKDFEDPQVGQLTTRLRTLRAATEKKPAKSP